MPSIDDIARIAGVSNTTVSNVINGKTNKVSKKTTDRINEIIKELGHVPNMSARALASKSSKVIAIINQLNDNARGSFIEDPFYSTFIGAVEEELRVRGYFLMVRGIENGNSLLTFLRNWNVDGLFVIGLFENNEIYDTLMTVDKPVISIDSYLRNYGTIINVGLEDYKGGYIATKHLIDNNHKKIVFVGASIIESGVVSERLRGYKQALEDSGIAFDKSLVYESEFSVNDTEELGRCIANIEGVTAIFATSDVLACGIMSGLRNIGKRIPEDYSIIGFDDINWCRMMTPKLTSIHQNPKEKGQIAAEFIIGLLNDKEANYDNVILPVSLIERESVIKNSKI